MLMLFSAKGGNVRGCLSGSLWLKSAVLVSPAPAFPTSPGSTGRLRVLPAPGARSKFSSMTAGLSAATLKAASERGEDVVHGNKCLLLVFSQQNTPYLSFMAFFSIGEYRSIYTTFFWQLPLTNSLPLIIMDVYPPRCLISNRTGSL